MRLFIWLSAFFFSLSASMYGQIGTATVTAVSQVAGNSSTPQTLKAVIIGCSQGTVPAYQNQSISVTPNQPSSAFILLSGTNVTVTLPGNDAIICSGQNYTTYALTWYTSGGIPEGPTQDFRFVEGGTYNTSTAQPVKFIPPSLNNTQGVLCPASTMLTGFSATFQPICTSYTPGVGTGSGSETLSLTGLSPTQIPFISVAGLPIGDPAFNFNQSTETLSAQNLSTGAIAAGAATISSSLAIGGNGFTANASGAAYVKASLAVGATSLGTGQLLSVGQLYEQSFAPFQVDPFGNVVASTVLKGFPQVDVTSPVFGPTNATGATDSTSATNNLTAFKAALVAALSPTIAGASAGQTGGVPLAVYIPPGVYAINGVLDIPNNVKMFSDSSVGAQIVQLDSNAPAIRVRGQTSPYPGCQTYACYGGLEHISLSGSGSSTRGSLLEMNTGLFFLNDLHFYNTGGRGIQMNKATERIVANNLTFYNVRWPIVMAGDSNEDNFFGLHIIEAGMVQQAGYQFSRFCYSTNCTAGNYPAAGTTASPTTLYQDPHAAVYVGKSVEVGFHGGDIKSSYMIGGFKCWICGNVRFEDFYHEASAYSYPTQTASYIVGGKAEQTYLTSAMTTTGLTAAVNDPSWMPEFYYQATDLPSSDYYGYVLIPQDYNPAITTASAYVPSINRNNFELVNMAGFTSDGTMHLQNRANGAQPSPQVSGVAWPAGTIVEQYSTSSPSTVIISLPHSNTVQFGQSANGWAYSCDPTTYRACGEMVFGYQPDVIAQTSNPATNLNGFYTVPGGTGYLQGTLQAQVDLEYPDLSTGANPAEGSIALGPQETVTVHTVHANLGALDTSAATKVTNGGLSLSLNAIGGNNFFAPTYSTGTQANVLVFMPELDEVWNGTGYYKKDAQVFNMYQQYGSFMVGQQFQNLNCMFDLNASGSNQSTNRFCVMGGPSNTGNTTSPGYGMGAEADYWNGSSWFQSMRAWPGGLFTQGAFTAASVNGEITVDGHAYTTLNAAWTAAVSAAGATHLPQTIKLGPGNYPITTELYEPSALGGAGPCVSLIGSSGNTTGADISNVGTTISLTAQSYNSTSGVYTPWPGVISDALQPAYLPGLTEGCTFKNFSISVGQNAYAGILTSNMRGQTIENVTINDPVTEGLQFGTTQSGYTSYTVGAYIHNVTVSYNSASFTPASRGAYGVEIFQGAIDSKIDNLTVRNAGTAAVDNQGGGWTMSTIHGFGYPYTCSAPPCNNHIAASSGSTVSYATDYLVTDEGTGGNLYADSYIDSPAIAGFLLSTNGVQINGGHIQWPETTSFPAANLANVLSTVSTNIIISNIDCLNMSSTAGAGLQAGQGVWVSFQATGSLPPAYSTVSNLAGCGAYYQSRSGSSQTMFERGSANMNNTNPGLSSGQNPKVLASQLASGSNYVAYSAQSYTGYTGDMFESHFSGQPSNFNILTDGSVRSSGGLFTNTQIYTSSGILTTANSNVLASTASGAFSLTLPSCYTYLPDGIRPTGLEMHVLKTDTSANALTLTTVSSQTINYQGVVAATLSLSAAGARTLICGSDNNWYAY